MNSPFYIYFFNFYDIIRVGDSMKKETKKKTTKAATSKKTTAAKKTTTNKANNIKKAETTKNNNNKKLSYVEPDNNMPKEVSKKLDLEKNNKNNKAKNNSANNNKAKVEKVVTENNSNENKNKEIEKNTKLNNIVNTKEVKKEENKKEEFLLQNNEMTNFIKIILAVVGIVLVLYLVTYIINKNKYPDKEDEKVEASIQYDQILVNKVLSQNKNEYYVLAKMKDDKYNDTYDVYVGSYTYKEGALKIYTADLSSAFNKNYVSEENNLNTNNLSEIKFSQTTLLKIKSGSIVEKFTSNEEIIAALEKL